MGSAMFATVQYIIGLGFLSLDCFINSFKEFIETVLFPRVFLFRETIVLSANKRTLKHYIN
jgi:hypothetical protein